MSPAGPGTGKTGNPTIFEYSSKTHERVLLVKRLRKFLTHERVLLVKRLRKRMTRSLPEIANDIGYSPSQILAYERGYDRHGKALPEKKWKRYIWALRGLCQEYGTLIDGEETRRQDAQGDARVQTRQSAPGHRPAGQKGRQGHKPKAGDRHRFERGPQSGRGGRPKDPLNVKFNVFEES